MFNWFKKKDYLIIFDMLMNYHQLENCCAIIRAKNVSSACTILSRRYYPWIVSISEISEV